MRVATSESKDLYLERVADGLTDLSEEDRDEVLQDLRAHLAEIDDDEVVATLGTPASFITEFRASAGLEAPAKRGRHRLNEVRAAVDGLAARLAQVTRWETIRPAWVWTRGWLLVSSIAVLTQSMPFEPFPIPRVEGALLGLLVLVVATFVSVWLDRHSDSRAGAFFSVAFSVLAATTLLFSSMGGHNLSRPGDVITEFIDENQLYEQLTSADGTPVYNIYAYDVDGNPTEVLLFDQSGRPLETMPYWVYEDAEHNPDLGSYDYPEGLVEFPRDQFGQPITNLYPLDIYDYERNPIVPPMQAPMRSQEEPVDEAVVTTTIPATVD